MNVGEKYAGLYYYVAILSRLYGAIIIGRNQQVDALVFALEGFEENTLPKHYLEPWRRTATGRTVRFTTIRNNSIFWSDDELNSKTRSSKFIRETEIVTPLEKCVFRKETTQEWSKGASKTEYAAYTSSSSAILDLNKAYRFEIVLEGPSADAHIVGPAVVCNADRSSCGNEWTKQIFPDDYFSYDVRSPSVLRRDKAIELLRRSCPGKPY